MKIAIVGATGVVGRKMIELLESSDLPVTELIPVASSRSLGTNITFKEKTIDIVSVKDAVKMLPRIALFSAGREISLEHVQKFADVGCKVIDNSSAWRKEAKVPLVVPEVNFHAIKKTDYIIANPNCSTIQLVMILAPLHRKFGVKRVVISTYQSVSGSGAAGIKQLDDERSALGSNGCYPHPIDLNVLPHGGDFLPNGITTEEEKLLFETRKILQDQSIAITATVARVPVVTCHCEAVNVEFYNDVKPTMVREVLSNSEGVVVTDNPKQNLYPMPINATGSDEVYVGRIRQDASLKNAIDLWIVADNLRKGAATNALQITEKMIKTGLV